MYRSLRVPEVWRYRKQGIEVHRSEGDHYVISESSGIFPTVPMSEFTNHLEMVRETSVGRAVRALCSIYGSTR